MDFIAWKARAAAELARRHGIAATSIPERIWKRLYLGNHAPTRAAEWAWTHYRNCLSPVRRRSD